MVQVKATALLSSDKPIDPYTSYHGGTKSKTYGHFKYNTRASKNARLRQRVVQQSRPNLEGVPFQISPLDKHHFPVYLRDPAERLLSCYLDKIVHRR